MTDRELLELAAKAAGIVIDKSPHNGGGHGNDGFDVDGSAVLDWHNGKRWNPLADDGDALRLAVALNLDLMFDVESEGGTCVAVIFPIKGDYDGVQELCGTQAGPAIRRAIVRAAAEIGRTK